MQRVYRILEIYELYEYVTRYDTDTRVGGLFAGYIVPFSKLNAWE